MSFVRDILDGITGKSAAETAARSSDAATALQREGLEYLKESQAPLLEAQGFGLSGLLDYYGGNQQGLVDQAMASPFYTSMLQQGEEATLRNAAATGGLRSGTTQNALAANSQNVLNSAIGQQLGGLGMLAGFNPNANAVTSQLNTIGNTTAQGITAQGQAQQAGLGNLINLGTSIAGMFSDERLKDNIKRVGKVNGHNWYSWTWNDVAEKLGLSGNSQGVLAQEVERVKPELISERDGYKTVNYAGIV